MRPLPSKISTSAKSKTIFLLFMLSPDYSPLVSLIIISNQSWIGKSRILAEEVENIFCSLVDKVLQEGINIADYYYCGHTREKRCGCRKPRSQLLLEAARDHKIDVKKSMLIGDMESDIIAGKNVGLETILVRTGCGKKFEHLTQADHVIDNINAVDKIFPGGDLS